MKANRVYHLIVSREGREPSFLAMRGRTDRIEVVSVEDGEVVESSASSPTRSSLESRREGNGDE